MTRKEALFFTASGDDGMTGILGPGRVPKYDLRIEAVGAVDEANAALGFARSLCMCEAVRASLQLAQRDLYHVMAEAAATPDNAARFRKVDSQRVQWLEDQMHTLGEQVQMPEEFVLPGDTPAAGALDLARSVVRRAERRMAELIYSAGGVENRELLRYLNRLSSLCFVLEIYEIQHAGPRTATLAKNIE